MASNQNPSEFSSTADSLIDSPAANTARTDTLSDAALSACRADCDTTWKTNWYEQQVNLLFSKWTDCETEAEAYRRQQERVCGSYGDPMTRGICYSEIFWLSENFKTKCVLDNAIRPNEGLKSPVDYISKERLSWYDGKNYCASRIVLNADAKSTICKNKNCR